MSSGEDDRSWSEIASDAAGVARSALTKLGKSMSQAVSALVPSEQQETTPPPRPPQRGYNARSNGNYGQLNPWERESRDLGPSSLIGGLFGRAVGGMLGGALQQLQHQQVEAAELQERALRAMQADRRLQSRLGSRISLGSAGGFSTSSSTQVIDGRSAVTVTMQFPVAGSSGRQALAVVRQAKGGSSSSAVTSIEVRMPEGDIVRVGEGGGRAGDRFQEGDVIDVEVRDVR